MTVSCSSNGGASASLPEKRVLVRMYTLSPHADSFIRICETITKRLRFETVFIV